MAPFCLTLALRLFGSTLSLVVEPANLHASAVVREHPSTVLLGVVVPLVGAVRPALAAFWFAGFGFILLMVRGPLAPCQEQRGGCIVSPLFQNSVS